MEPRFTDTRIILGKSLTFSLNSTALYGHPFMWTTDTYFLPDPHRMPASLMGTLHNQLCVVIDLSSLKVENPSVDSTSMFPALPHTG